MGKQSKPKKGHNTEVEMYKNGIELLTYKHTRM